MRIHEITEAEKLDESLLDDLMFKWQELVDWFQEKQYLRKNEHMKPSDVDVAVMQAIRDFDKALEDRDVFADPGSVRIIWLSPLRIRNYQFGDRMAGHLIERDDTNFTYAIVDADPLLKKFIQVYQIKEVDFSDTKKVEAFSSSIQHEADVIATKMKEAARWKSFLERAPRTIRSWSKRLTESEIEIKRNDRGVITLRLFGHRMNHADKTVEVVINANPATLGVTIRGRAKIGTDQIYDASATPRVRNLTFDNEADNSLKEIIAGSINSHNQVRPDLDITDHEGNITD